MILAAPYSKDSSVYPEWPRKLNRLVRTLDLAVNCPNHVGRFHGYAFPHWWRALSQKRLPNA